MVKTLPAIQETQVQSLGWKDPLEKGMATSSSILAWESYGQRSLVGYSPWDQKESDTTEQLHTHTYASIETQKRRAMHEKHKTLVISG